MAAEQANDVRPEQLLAREQAARIEAEATVKRLREILAITDTALRFLPLEDSLRKLLRLSGSVLAVDAAAFLLRSEDGQKLIVCASFGLGAEIREGVHVPGGQGIVGRILAERKPILVEELLQAAEESPFLSDQLRTLLGAPLLNDSGAIGVVLVGTFGPRRFSEEDQRLLQLIADRAASVIEHAHLFEQVRAGRERAQILSQQLMEAQEVERRHLARELHDEIGQALTAVKINLQSLERSPDPSAVSPRLEESVAIVDTALQQVRNLSLNLRPSLLDDLGLVAALRWYLDRHAQRAGLAVEFVAQPPGIRASPGVETACFRVAQEALTNVLRHAKAQKVRVELRQGDAELQLILQDDGIGFEVAAARQRASRGGSLGLLGMHERVLLMGGHIEIKSARGRGTEVQVRLPLTALPSLERRSKRRPSP